MTCPVRYDEARHLAQIDDAESLDEAIEALMAGEYYDPTDPNNLWEAVGEWDASFRKQLSDQLRAGNFHAFGELIANHCEAYWRKQAEKRAKADRENARADAAISRYEARRSA